MRAQLNGHGRNGHVEPAGASGEGCPVAAGALPGPPLGPSATAAEAQPSPEGRDAPSGRFTEGNRFGKGNPHARSRRKQINVRADDETLDRLAALVARVGARLRLDLSQADVVRLALIELEKAYPPQPGEGAVTPHSAAGQAGAEQQAPAPPSGEQGKGKRKGKGA
jgi:hypothetical protein